MLCEGDFGDRVRGWTGCVGMDGWMDGWMDVWCCFYHGDGFGEEGVLRGVDVCAVVPE